MAPFRDGAGPAFCWVQTPLGAVHAGRSSFQKQQNDSRGPGLGLSGALFTNLFLLGSQERQAPKAVGTSSARMAASFLRRTS